MKTLNINPQFTQVMVNNGILRGHEMTIVDVGASGGYFQFWNIFGDQLKVIGFEPNEEQFKRLTSNNHVEYFKVGLGKCEEEKIIHITKWPYSSGSYMPNMSFWHRFPSAEGFEIVGSETIRTVRLDNFREMNGIRSIDYMKLDTEGSELDILEGSVRTLDDVIAVEIEVAFTEVHISRPLFTDIDIFMRERGFSLYNMETIKLARKALMPIETNFYSPSHYGQTLAADVLYMKDTLAQSLNRDMLIIDSYRAIKTICLYEIFCQYDSAIELLELALKSKILPGDFECCLDILVPNTLDRHLSLKQYRDIAMTLPQPL